MRLSKVVYKWVLWQVFNYNWLLIISLYLGLLQSHQNLLMASELPKMSKMNLNDLAWQSLKYSVRMQSFKLVSEISTWWHKGTAGTIAQTGIFISKWTLHN